MNNLMNNPAHAEAATFVQPDWNAAYGVGVAAPTNYAPTFSSLYTSAKSGEKTRANA